MFLLPNPIMMTEEDWKQVRVEEIKHLMEIHGLTLNDIIAPIPTTPETKMSELPPQPHEIDKPTACIIAFKEQSGRPIHYEVVIDPRQKSPSQRMIRFDSTKGSEVHGWQPLDSFHIVEVLKAMEEAEFDALIKPGSVPVSQRADVV